MKTFQITLDGYDPSTSETDDLIIWINAKSLETVEEFMKKPFEPPCNSIEEISYKTDDIVDLVLDD